MVIISCILFVAVCILVGAAICGFESQDLTVSGIFLACATMVFCVMWVIPTSSKWDIIYDPSQYVEIFPLKSGGLLVVNSETKHTIYEYDIRFIKAYEENQLFIKTTRNFNFFRYKISEKASLEINKE